MTKFYLTIAAFYLTSAMAFVGAQEIETGKPIHSADDHWRVAVNWWDKVDVKKFETDYLRLRMDCAWERAWQDWFHQRVELSDSLSFEQNMRHWNWQQRQKYTSPQWPFKQILEQSIGEGSEMTIIRREIQQASTWSESVHNE